MADYSRKGHYYIEEPRREVLQLITQLPEGAFVLDVGAGFGNNTRALLAAGHRVTALETNPEAIRALEVLRTIYPAQLDVVTQSVDGYKSPRHYDAVVCCMVLHFLESPEAVERAIWNLKASTKRHGFHLIISYLNSNKLDAEYSFLMGHNELLNLYGDWQVVTYKETYARTVRTVRDISDAVRLFCGQKGYKAARLIAQKG